MILEFLATAAQTASQYGGITEGATEIIDKAASKDDRWMFIAVLFVGFSAAIFVTRWFMARYNDLVVKLESLQEQFTAYLMENNKELAVLLAQTNELIRKNNEVLTEAMKVNQLSMHILEQTENRLRNKL